MPKELDDMNSYELIVECFRLMKEGSDTIQEHLNTLKNYTRDAKIKNLVDAMDKHMEGLEKYGEIGSNIANKLNEEMS